MQGSRRFIYIFFNDNTHCETKKIGFNVGRRKTSSKQITLERIKEKKAK